MNPSKKKALIAAGVGVVLLATLVILFLRTPYPARFAFERIQEELRVNYRLDLRAGRTELDVARGTLTLHDVRLQSLANPDLPPLAQAREVFARLDVSQLLRGHYVLESGGISGLSVNVAVTKDGRTNLPQPQNQGPFRGLPDVVIKSFTAEGAAVVVDDRLHDLNLELPQWNVRITGKSGPVTHGVRLGLTRPGTLRAAGRTVPIEQLDAGIVLSRNDIDSVQLNLRASETPLQVRGSIRNLSVPNLDLTFDAVADLQRLAALAQADLQVAGSLRVSARVTGKAESASATGHLEGDSLSGFGYDRIRLQSDYRVSRGDPRLNLDRLEIRSTLR